MSTPARHLGISFGELDHFHDGLGEYARQFGLQLAARAPALARDHGVRVHFHMPERWHGHFGDAVNYLPVTRQQRHWHTVPGIRFDVWHNLHQLIRQRPPWGARHVITTLHDLNMVYAKRGFSRWRALNRQIRLLKRADEIVCISDHVLQDLRRLTPLRTPALRIYNGVHPLDTVPQEALDLPDGSYLFHIGRMTPNKNVGCLIDLAAAWPDQLFVFVGPRTGYTEGYERQAQERGLRNVRFFFNVTEGQKAWLYAHSEGLLFPSITEGFGLPPIEAMRFGKPVYLSRGTSLPEIGGPVAQFFDAFDAASMRQVIEHGRAQATAPDFAQRTRDWAAQFDWTTCVDAYVQRYVAAWSH